MDIYPKHLIDCWMLSVWPGEAAVGNCQLVALKYSETGMEQVKHIFRLQGKDVKTNAVTKPIIKQKNTKTHAIILKQMWVQKSISSRFLIVKIVCEGNQSMNQLTEIRITITEISFSITAEKYWYLQKTVPCLCVCVYKHGEGKGFCVERKH